MTEDLRPDGVREDVAVLDAEVRGRKVRVGDLMDFLGRWKRVVALHPVPPGPTKDHFGPECRYAVWDDGGEITVEAGTPYRVRRVEVA